MTDSPILGFLMYGPMSGYDIKRRMALSTAHFYQASFGSIYPALARFEREGLAESSRSEGSGRLRKKYQISPKGRSAFLEWLSSPLDIAKGPSALLIRLFFLGCLPRAKAQKAIAAFREAASARQSRVEALAEGLPQRPDFFQSSTQRFGAEYYAFVASWLCRLESELPDAATLRRRMIESKEASTWEKE